jgi:hypothetical protein
LRDLDADEMLILKCTLEGVDWIQLVQDRVQWWAFLNMILMLWSFIKAGYFLTTSVTLLNKDPSPCV